jgi:hypothetical protein
MHSPVTVRCFDMDKDCRASEAEERRFFFTSYKHIYILRRNLGKLHGKIVSENFSSLPISLRTPHKCVYLKPCPNPSIQIFHRLSGDGCSLVLRNMQTFRSLKKFQHISAVVYHRYLPTTHHHAIFCLIIAYCLFPYCLLYY